MRTRNEAAVAFAEADAAYLRAAASGTWADVGRTAAARDVARVEYALACERDVLARRVADLEQEDIQAAMALSEAYKKKFPNEDAMYMAWALGNADQPTSPEEDALYEKALTIERELEAAIEALNTWDAAHPVKL